ncbi:MAG: aerobic respiration control sensor protein ArcB [Methanoregula sp. PtaU1.Bin051]|nr:MAG: aerobic respiration control sensor protein ArcB [Methanoregula sp. PtaU1.Bin051]
MAVIAVLLVDDHSDLMGAARSVLEKSGEIRIDVSHSAKQALERIRNRAYDVIVCYEQVPDVNGVEFVADMTGIDFIRYLKGQGNTTPVILLARRPPGKAIMEEVTYGSEVAFSRGGDQKTQLADLVLLIKQTMLRKKAERELKAQNEQLASILSATPLGIFQVHNSTITWVNRTCADMLGYEESQLVGRTARSLVNSEEEYEQLMRDLSLKHTPGGQGAADCRLKKNDGGTIACRLQVQAADPYDIAKGGTFVVTDITEKKKLSDALKQSEARYRDVLANTQSIIMRMDLQGTITFFNTYALSFFDYTEEEVIGKNVVGTIVAEKGRAGHDLSTMANDLGFNAEGYAINVSENIRRNGDRVWIAWINKAIRNEQGHIVEVLCIGHDITDRRRGSGEIRISTDTWKDQVVSDTDIREDVFDTVFHICTEISIEGREGKAVGTTFLIGDAKNVLDKSRQIMLNAFEGHKPELRMVTNPDLKENIKEFAQLDGAFVITGDGFIEASGRYITVDTSCVTLPKGMGTRHNSVAAITSVTDSVGIVVSQSGGGITIFKNGQILKKISL